MPHERVTHAPHERCDVLIIGGGPAGLAAALEIKRLLGAGLTAAKIKVIEREEEIGGTPRLCHHTGFGLRDLYRLHSGPGYAQEYRRRVEAAAIDVQTSATVTGWLDAHTVMVTTPRGVQQIEAQAILLATGCRERPAPARGVAGSRPQGIYTTGSLQRFVYQHGQQVGKRAVIAGAETISLSALLTLHHANVTVAAMVTEHPHHQIPLQFLPVKWVAAGRRGVQVLGRVRVNQIIGHKRVEAVELVHLDSEQVETIGCDTVVFTGDWIPEHELARLGGIEVDPATRGPRVDTELRTSTPGIFAAGNLLRGAEAADYAAMEGRHAARAMARYLAGAPWPTHWLPITPGRQMAWLVPNALPAHPYKPFRAHPPFQAHFRFQVNQFCRSAQIQVYQGEKELYRHRFRRLTPNQSAWISSDWLAAVDYQGEALHWALL
jgi:thioredoxin reductase